MKQLILILLTTNIILAERLYDCDSQSRAIVFEESVQVFAVDKNEQLTFYAIGQVIAPVQTDYLQIRVYGDGPEFKTLQTERFSYYPASYSTDAYIEIADFADWKGLQGPSYKIQVDVFDPSDDQIGCAAFYVLRSQYQTQE